LRLERVDNLGAYRIPSETGILIPSDFPQYPASQPIQHRQQQEDYTLATEPTRRSRKL